MYHMCGKRQLFCTKSHLMAERGLHKLIFIPFSLYLLTIFFTFGRSFFSRFLCTRSLPFSSLLHIYEP
ncbi:Predicted protein [Anoxybacillus flavithermus WK1]|uniref:Uncharacterized protein n=1 Tax=Anoxybacillus flavithermus (strain DSM 21510 / WK1) TaxID=491915 RepID=B7GHV2_ANOFW|nr:Predicted protein [Anoxybacillus flavithermus WK1]